MTHKHLFRTLLTMVLLTILLLGCGLTPTPDPSIVWSDDFEDGNTEGWEDSYHDVLEDEYFVSEGVLSFGDTAVGHEGNPDGGDIKHPSTITNGTWSFDAFFPEERNNEISICLGCEQGWMFGFGMRTSNSTNSMVYCLILDHANLVTVGASPLGRKLTGWNHFDFTRDDLGNSKIFLNGELILECKDELSLSSDMLYFNTTIPGPALDNVVVRNQVIGIQPTE